MVITMIGSYNYIGTIFNGYNRRHDTVVRIIVSYTHKFYIKDGNESCHFVGNSHFKPIEYVALFKLKENSATLTSSIASSTLSKTNNKYSNASSTSVKNTSHEVSGKIAAVNEPQENLPSSDVMSIDQ